MLKLYNIYMPLSMGTLRFPLSIPGLNAEVSRGGFDEEIETRLNEAARELNK